MSKCKFLIIFGIALLLTLVTTTSSEARNTPRIIDRDTEYSHPWGGDENSGGTVNSVVTPVQPDDSYQYKYIDGTKGGLVFGAVQFFWKNFEAFLTSYTLGSSYDTKTTRDGSTTSNNTDSVDDGREGGQQ